MAWMDAINDIVSRYSGAGSGTASAPADPHQDYANIARSAPPEVMADALSHTFRSDQTPSFPEMVSNMFQASNPGQRAGLLNQLASTLGPTALASIPGLRNMVGNSGNVESVTPEKASQISPQQVQQMADHAQRANPSVVDMVSGFYARHPDVVKAIGGAAISIAIQRIARRR